MSEFYLLFNPSIKTECQIQMMNEKSTNKNKWRINGIGRDADKSIAVVIHYNFIQKFILTWWSQSHREIKVKDQNNVTFTCLVSIDSIIRRRFGEIDKSQNQLLLQSYESHLRNVGDQEFKGILFKSDTIDIPEDKAKEKKPTEIEVLHSKPNAIIINTVQKLQENGIELDEKEIKIFNKINELGFSLKEGDIESFSSKFEKLLENKKITKEEFIKYLILRQVDDFVKMDLNQFDIQNGLAKDSISFRLGMLFNSKIKLTVKQQQFINWYREEFPKKKV